MPHKDLEDLEALRQYMLEYRANMSKDQLLRKSAKQKDWWDSPKGKYSSQKYHAKRRDIPWEFTFETWWEVWEKSGKWEERGANSGQYCMCRYGDEGPYSSENVYIALSSDNKRDAFINNKVSTPTGLFYKDML